LPDAPVMSKNRVNDWLGARDGWRWAWGLALAYAAGLAVAAWALGAGRVLTWAGAPHMGLAFSDLHVIAAARAELAAGGDPYASNPGDPWGRVYNYPSVWMKAWPIEPATVAAWGVALGVAWLATVGAWWGRLSRGQGVVAGLLLAAPPVVLALERANNDLVIFMLLAGALACLARGWGEVAAGLAWAGFALKLYPLAGMVALVRLGWRRACLVGGVVLLLAGAYVWAQWDEVGRVLGNTPADTSMAYGATVGPRVLAEWLTRETGRRHDVTALLPHARVWAAVLAVLALAHGWRAAEAVRRAGGPERAQSRALDGFRAAAGIYAATFVLGANYDYRLIFWLLAVPWLTRGAEAGEARAEARARRAALGGVIALMWANPWWGGGFAVVRELAAWGLLVMACWWLGRTLPARARSGAGAIG
jgi:hypothetical protein